jgi:hypothetical protein
MKLVLGILTALAKRSVALWLNAVFLVGPPLQSLPNVASRDCAMASSLTKQWQGKLPQADFPVGSRSRRSRICVVRHRMGCMIPSRI